MERRVDERSPMLAVGNIYVEPVTAEDRIRARLLVCGMAETVDEARELLCALGLFGLDDVEAGDE